MVKIAQMRNYSASNAQNVDQSMLLHQKMMFHPFRQRSDKKDCLNTHNNKSAIRTFV